MTACTKLAHPCTHSPPIGERESVRTCIVQFERSLSRDCAEVCARERRGEMGGRGELLRLVGRGPNAVAKRKGKTPRLGPWRLQCNLPCNVRRNVGGRTPRLCWKTGAMVNVIGADCTGSLNRRVTAEMLRKQQVFEQDALRTGIARVLDAAEVRC